jgi:hypothetical protein
MIPFIKYVEEEMTGTSSVAGAGDDSNTVIVRKKYDKKKRRKDMEKILKRFMELKKRK